MAAAPNTEHVRDDHSAAFHKVRGTLVDSRGRKYLDFVRSLCPDFWTVWRDLAFGYVCLFASAVFAAALPSAGTPGIVTVIIGAILIGYWIAYIQLFIHEGAHYNLAPTRAVSDRVCNLLIGWMVGTTVAKYRVVHFQHHRALGTVDDSEMTYFFPLNAVFIVKALFGLRAIEVLLGRNRLAGREAERKPAKPISIDRTFVLVVAGGLCAHGAIVLALWLSSGYAAAAAWVLGVGMVFPFFGALRQLLEHRDDAARNDTDYRTTDHGAFTRVFGDDAFSRTFGGAGFNRHLLHHWEPQVSYTNLPALEGFLRDTEMRGVIEARRSSYGAIFATLFASRAGTRRGPTAEELRSA